MDPRVFQIIGGGTIGLSTAWHLLDLQTTEVVILDNADPLAPSRDISKFVRVDYPDQKRMMEAMEAKHLWETHHLFSPHFHPAGRLVAYSPEDCTLTGITHARASLGMPERRIDTASSETMVADFVRIPLNCRWVHNEDDGIVSWAAAIQSLKQDCQRKQATFCAAHVTRLDTGCGAITGIATKKGYIHAKHTEVILAAGPWIAPLLAASSIERPPSHRLPIVTGIFAIHLRLDKTQQVIFQRLPPYSEIGKGTLLQRNDMLR